MGNDSCVTQGGRPSVAEEIRTLDEQAAYLQVPKSTLYQWRLKGFGPPAIKVGKHLRYRACDTDKWLAAEAAKAPRTA